MPPFTQCRGCASPACIEREACADREAVAKIIDPEAFKYKDRFPGRAGGGDGMADRADAALAKADAIIEALAASRIEALSEGGYEEARRPEHCAGETEPSPGAGKWRKRPVVVDAWRWSGENWSAAPDWLADAERLYGIAVAGEVRRVDPDLQIFTLEGVHTANAGDWIIRGIQGELYPCKPDIFAATYEPASGTLDGSSRKTSSQGGSSPVDMILHCPACGLQHIDAREPMTHGAMSYGPGDAPWTNPPHRSHLCLGCGHIWRPADIATNGVAKITTKGKADSPARRDGEKTALKDPPQVEGEGHE